MESEEGVNTAKTYNEVINKGYGTFLGMEILVGESAEPSDIIWEN